MSFICGVFRRVISQVNPIEGDFGWVGGSAQARRFLIFFWHHQYPVPVSRFKPHIYKIDCSTKMNRQWVWGLPFSDPIFRFFRVNVSLPIQASSLVPVRATPRPSCWANFHVARLWPPQTQPPIVEIREKRGFPTPTREFMGYMAFGSSLRNAWVCPQPPLFTSSTFRPSTLFIEPSLVFFIPFYILDSSVVWYMESLIILRSTNHKWTRSLMLFRNLPFEDSIPLTYCP